MEIKPLKPKKCKVGGEQFTPIRFGQPTCFEHAFEYLLQQRLKKQARNNRKLKRDMMTLSDHKKDLEKVFNEYIRERDRNDPCISCGATKDFRPTAGHYFPTTHGSVRFNEDNVHVQCWFNCNKNKHGNLSEYLPRLIKKIGQKRFEEMQRIKNQVTWKPSIPEVILLKEEYKEKLRKEKKKNEKTNN